MVDYYVNIIIIDALCYIFVFLGKRCARHYMVVKFRFQLLALKGNLWGDLNFYFFQFSALKGNFWGGG